MITLRPIKFIKSFQCDVLIYDDICQKWLAKSLPEECERACISTRFSIPLLLSFRFLWCLIWRLRPLRPGKRHYLFEYLSVLIETTQPKVLISGADNNFVVAEISQSYPEVWVILVQTALRDTNQGFPTEIKLPTYWSFGQCERSMFTKLGVSCEELVPIGSIKLGYALAFSSNKEFTQKDICFVSTLRPERVVDQSQSLLNAIDAVSDSLFRYACQYAEQHHLRLRVLGKSRESHLHTKEHSHYTRLSDGYPFEFVSAEKEVRELDTYFALFASDLIIHNASTLGFEALAAGKRVLFGASISPGLIEDWGIQAYFDQLPSFVCVQTDDYRHFEKKVDELRKLSDRQYASAILAASKAVIAQDEPPPHKKIEKAIGEFLNS